MGGELRMTSIRLLAQIHAEKKGVQGLGVCWIYELDSTSATFM